MATYQQLHIALDGAMATWAIATHGLFSDTKISELVKWLDDRTTFHETAGYVRELVDRWKADTGLAPDQHVITELVVWSWEQVQGERVQHRLTHGRG
jgi:hypothetical protein